MKIDGVGSFPGRRHRPAVISRKAARESGHTAAERAALVVDLFFASRRAGERFSETAPKFAIVAWEPGPPMASND
ncbi:MAG: hypothetical protein WDO13_18820 [Verrucomicrobiota bacterium]